jgi:dimethylamine--corrinoid protein Co-methyltransferase
MSKIVSRMGDGFPVELSESELLQDIEDGTLDAAQRAEIPALSDDEQKHLFEISKSIYKISAVEKGVKSF